MKLDYRDKVALITGASGGIGAAIARALAAEGATVILVARRRQRLDQLVDELTAAGARAARFVCDVTDEAGVDDLAKQAKAKFGQVHLLVNNAGRGLLMPLQVTKCADAREVLEVNVVAMACVTRKFLPLLKPGSAVVNMASALAFQGAAAMSVYSASKGAAVSMTRSLARELAGRGIRVNAVAPGMVRTELMQRLVKNLSEEQMSALEAKHPLGFGRAEDVAAAVAFLGSDRARWITGETLVVDGGLTA